MWDFLVLKLWPSIIFTEISDQKSTEANKENLQVLMLHCEKRLTVFARRYRNKLEGVHLCLKTRNLNISGNLISFISLNISGNYCFMFPRLQSKHHLLWANKVSGVQRSSLKERDTVVWPWTKEKASTQGWKTKNNIHPEMWKSSTKLTVNSLLEIAFFLLNVVRSPSIQSSPSYFESNHITNEVSCFKRKLN